MEPGKSFAEVLTGNKPLSPEAALELEIRRSDRRVRRWIWAIIMVVSFLAFITAAWLSLSYVGVMIVAAFVLGFAGALYQPRTTNK